MNRPRLQTAPHLPSSTFTSTITKPFKSDSSTFFGNKNNQNSAQDVVKYLNDASSNFVIPRSFLNENHMPLLKMPNELPVLTLDENF
uniref:Uncharacterized protein n=1 Tax=Panagrolaimus sp. ES5 TaxID=591445 RepID=A0AC34FQ78_9BILA